MLTKAGRWQRYRAFLSCVSVSNLSNWNNRGNFTNNRCTSIRNNTPWHLRLNERNCVWIINVKKWLEKPESSLHIMKWNRELTANQEKLNLSKSYPRWFFSRKIIAFRKVKKNLLILFLSVEERGFLSPLELCSNYCLSSQVFKGLSTNTHLLPPVNLTFPCLCIRDSYCLSPSFNYI